MKTVRIAVALSSIVAAMACSKSNETSPPRSADMEQASPESVQTEHASRSRMPANAPYPGSTETAPLPDHPTPGTADGTPPSSWSAPVSPSIGGGPRTAPADRAMKDTNPSANPGENQGGIVSGQQSDQAAQPPVANDPDQALTDKIRAALQEDESLSPSAKNVDITTSSGKVTLRGTVKSQAEKKAVEAKARQLAGSGEIDSKIRVKK